MDFILVSVPMLLMTLTVIGLAFNGFARNIAQDVAVDTARYAALADQDSTLARERAIRGMSLILPRFWAPDVQVRKVSSSSSCVYEALVTVKSLSMGLVFGVGQIRESARAVCELQG